MHKKTEKAGKLVEKDSQQINEYYLIFSSFKCHELLAWH